MVKVPAQEGNGSRSAGSDMVQIKRLVCHTSGPSWQ